ncbi:DELLA protein GAIP [Glycine max]|nr:DELLA protein GAIP [Glycine max]
MEDINRWLSFYVNGSVNHDFAIRKYCPARMEQEQGGEWQDQEAAVVFYDTELCSSSDATGGSTPCLVSSEVDDFVDGFYEYENENQGSQEKHHQSFDHFVVNDEDDAYSMVNGGVFEYVPTTLEDSELEIHEALTTTMWEEEVQICGSFGAIPELTWPVLKLWDVETTNKQSCCLEEFGLWQVLQETRCFAKGLKCRLSLLPHNVIANGTLTSISMDVPLISRENKMEAFQLLYQTTPYISFGFMGANEVIYQASQGKSSMHIVDLGMENTLQWSSLIRALASRPEGHPTLRITGLTGNEDNSNLQTSMNLNKYVKESRGYLKEILLSIKKLGPTALTVVEQDTNHNGHFFLGRFLESLHYYSAIFDSLEPSMPRNRQHRMKIERLHFAEEIRNVVAYEGQDRIERHERVDQWRRQLGRAGFQVMPLKCNSQVRMMLSVYDCDGYTLSSEKGNLLLGWKGRPVIMASACL